MKPWQLAPASLAALLGLAAGPAQADDEAARQQVQQRLRMSGVLMADLETVERIAQSGRADAQTHLKDARQHQAQGEDLLQRGELASARREADEALRHITTARRLVPNPYARLAAQRQRYEQVHASLERLMESWRSRAGAAGQDDADHRAALEQLKAAEAQAQAGRHDDAVLGLAEVERRVLAGMNRLLASGTLDYTVRAETPAQELELELRRHQSLAELLPLAVRDLHPSAEKLALIERYQDASQALQAQAVASGQRGEHAQALDHLRNATLFLQRALAAAGLVTPQPTGNPS